MGYHSIDCPPGRLTCEDDQFAICRVRNGKPEGKCVPIPSAARASQQAIENWALEQITGNTRGPEQRITVAERQLLVAGIYSPDPSLVVRFKLPVAMGRGQEEGELTT